GPGRRTPRRGGTRCPVRNRTRTAGRYPPCRRPALAPPTRRRSARRLPPPGSRPRGWRASPPAALAALPASSRPFRRPGPSPRSLSFEYISVSIPITTLRGSLSPRPFWTNADDRLALDPLCRVEGGNGVVEGRDVADVRPHSPVTRPPDNLTQLGAIGHDNEVDRQAVGGPCLGRAGDGHQRSSGANQACGPL